MNFPYRLVSVRRRKLLPLCKTAVLVLLLCSLSGCFLAPFIESFKQVGATEADRQALLSREVKKFTDALFWGNPGPIMERVDASARATVQAQVEEATGKERVVESRISKMDFQPDSYLAKVDVKVRYYKIPFYVVTERNETLDWEFSISDGWLLKGRSIG